MRDTDFFLADLTNSKNPPRKHNYIQIIYIYLFFVYIKILVMSHINVFRTPNLIQSEKTRAPRDATHAVTAGLELLASVKHSPMPKVEPLEW